jgi:hypothetical protein
MYRMAGDINIFLLERFKIMYSPSILTICFRALSNVSHFCNFLLIQIICGVSSVDVYFTYVSKSVD